MRIAVDIAEPDLKEIDRLAAAQHRSRNTVIQDAIATYITERRGRALNDAFGLWGDHDMDGLEYQRKLRDEW